MSVDRRELPSVELIMGLRGSTKENGDLPIIHWNRNIEFLRQQAEVDIIAFMIAGDEDDPHFTRRLSITIQSPGRIEVWTIKETGEFYELALSRAKFRSLMAESLEFNPQNPYLEDPSNPQWASTLFFKHAKRPGRILAEEINTARSFFSNIFYPSGVEEVIKNLADFADILKQAV